MDFKGLISSKKVKWVTMLSVGAIALACSSIDSVYADSETTNSADNSKINKEYQDKSGISAEQQSNKKSDLEITQRIRRDVVKDKSLSTYGHNVKIITDKGKVTLKGPVNSAEEKANIEQKAKRVAGAENVRDQLEVAVKD